MKKVISLIALLFVALQMHAQLSVSISHTNCTCNGTCNGTAMANPTGGSSPYVYSWTPSGGTSQSASGLCAGNYTVTVTDAVFATATQTVLITQPTALSLSFSTTNISCNGGTGNITATVSGGTPPYTYNWMPGNYVMPTITNVTVGNYTCTVTDANGCTVVNTVVLTQPSLLTQTLSWTYAMCGNPNGTATSTPSGGTAPYSYLWTPGNMTAQTVTALASATYTCTVTDANGCSYSSNVFVPATSNPTVTVTSTNTTCNASCNGTLMANFTGGTGPFTYYWTPTMQTTASLTNVCAGTYTVVITDSFGCVGVANGTVAQPSSISVSMSSTPATCGNPDGTATATPSGGTPPYTYVWSPVSQTTTTATGLLAGVYTCNVTDANGCTGTGTVTIINTGGPVATISSLSNVTCYAGSDGSATVNVTGGATPYTYSWSPYGGAAATASNLDGFTGTFSVLVTDATGCTTIATVTITQPTPITITPTSTTISGCNLATGSITVNVTGGTPAYTYAWSPSGPASTTNSNMTPNMNYTFNVTDVNGCTGMLGLMVGDSCAYVWPGDANEDAVADNNDILAIGIANGATGYLRINPSLTWIGQAPNTDWTQSFASGVNYKYADCDGNGTIANADTNAVVLNFGNTHTMRSNYAPVYNASLPDLTVHMNQSQIGSGNPGTLSVSLGNSTTHANNVYGVAFTLNFDPALIDASSFGMNNSNCWMGTVGTNLMGVVLRPANGSGSVQVAVTRYDHNNANGFGTIADLGFTTTSAFMGTFQNQDVIFTVSNVTVISANETAQQVNMMSDTVNVCDPGVLAVMDNVNYADVKLYPNPSKDKFTITLPANASGKDLQMTLTDATGRIVMQQVFRSAANEFQISNIESGIYFCTVKCDGKIIGVQKLVKE